MPLNEWSKQILIAELNDEPAFSDDMDALGRRLEDASGPLPDVIVNLKAVTYLNSSNIAQLLKLRKQLHNAEARMRICAVSNEIYSVIATTGLDKMFQFTDDVSTSLTSLHMSGE